MFRRLPLMSLILLFVAVVPVLAQRNCPTIVLDTLNQLGDNCAGLDRNAACYGFDRVDSTFFVPQPEGTFSEPTDRASLLDLSTVQTYPLDEETGEFGAAVMNVQANVPNALPGQGVIFLLLGDATVENAVQPEDSARVIDAIPVPVAVDANLYTSPTETANIRIVAPANELLPIDGLTPQGLWARAIVNDEVLWVRTEDLTQSAALNALPTVGSSQRMPMQAFYFSTGLGAPACNEAEPVIAVQSPENITVDLTVNGVDIRVGSLVTFKLLDENSALVTVHRGSVQTTTGQTIEANESAIARLGPEGGINSWQPPQPISDLDYERGQQVQFALNNVARANDWPERDVTRRDVPEATPTPTIEAVVTATPTALPAVQSTITCGDVTYTVQPGDNLFRIALAYEASMPAIIEANDLADPQNILVGQQLRIPNACGGFVGADAPTRVPSEVTEEPGQEPDQQPVSCAGFRLVYPTTNVPVGDTLYEWTPIQGATRYEAVFYDYTGALAATYSTNGPENQIYLNTGRIPTGSELYWEVRAYAGEDYLCVTPRSGKITRLADPNDNVQAPAYSPIFTLTSCFFNTGVGLFEASVDWSGADPSDTITMQIYDTGGLVTGSNTGTGAAGTVVSASGATPYKISAVASIAGGYTEFFPSC